MKITLEDIYKHYPRKHGKKMGQMRLQKLLKSKTVTFEEALNAVKFFKAECEEDNREKKFIPHWSTFVNNHIEDYVELSTEEFAELEDGQNLIESFVDGDDSRFAELGGLL